MKLTISLRWSFLSIKNEAFDIRSSRSTFTKVVRSRKREVEIRVRGG